MSEAFTGHKNGFDYYYHQDSHTSLIGVRGLANHSHCFESDAEVERWIEGVQLHQNEIDAPRPKPFAYPAQSNMNGRRLPFSWSSTLCGSYKHPNTYTLLDVAALVSTSPLDLSEHTTAPDFMVLSFYKMFGFPDLGGVIIRKSAAHVFGDRKYFGGGTTEMVTCTRKPWVERKKTNLHERLEDGTGAIHNILALQCAIFAQDKLFGGFDEISRHTGWLTKCLYEKMVDLKHANGRSACRIYKDSISTYGDARTQGATIAFNICRRDGTWIGTSEVRELAEKRNIHIRTGSLCNPVGMAFALGLDAGELRKIYETGFRCGQEDDVINGVPLGMVRVSFGAMSTVQDVDVCAVFLEECILEKNIVLRTGSTKNKMKGLSIDENIAEKVSPVKSGQRAISKPKSWFKERWKWKGKNLH